MSIDQMRFSKKCEMGKRKTPCCDSSQVKRGPWSVEESERLRDFVLQNGHPNWRSLPKLAGLKRCGKSCRLRWINYLRPDLKRGNFTKEEEDSIINLHQALGNKWSKIASHFPGRTDNEIKNVWNTHLKKRLMKNDSSASSDVTDQPSSRSYCSSSSSSTISSVSSEVTKIKTHNQEEEFEELLTEDMACGFEVNAPQSLDFLFEDHRSPLAPIPKPELLDIRGQTLKQELCSQMVEPGLDEYNEWLNYLNNES